MAGAERRSLRGALASSTRQSWIIGGSRLLALCAVLSLATEALAVSMRLPSSPVKARILEKIPSVLPPVSRSHFKVELLKVPPGYDIGTSTYSAWALTSGRVTYRNLIFPAALYSSLAPVSEGKALPFPTNGWNEVNYLLNNKDALFDAGAHYHDLQSAISLILGQSVDVPPGRSNLVESIVSEAAEHRDFVPGAGQLAAVIVVFGRQPAETTVRELQQDLILELRVGQPEQICAYTQFGWDELAGWDPIRGPSGNLLAENFAWVYGNGLRGTLTLGKGKTLTFSSADAIQQFLPAAGPATPLPASAIDPGSSQVGAFAGQVLALRLNVDFSDAGITGNPVNRFGDQVLKSKKMKVREVLALAERALGGQSVPMKVPELTELLDRLNTAYAGCSPSAWAMKDLQPPMDNRAHSDQPSASELVRSATP